MQIIIDTDREKVGELQAALAALRVLIAHHKPEGDTFTVTVNPKTRSKDETLQEVASSIRDIASTLTTAPVLAEAPGDMPTTDEAENLEDMTRDELDIAPIGVNTHRKRENTLRDMIREARGAVTTDETPADDEPELDAATVEPAQEPEPEPAREDEADDPGAEDEPQADGPTFDDAMALAKDLMAKGKAGRLKAILLGLGVEKMPGLKDDPAKIAAFVEKAQKIALAVGDEA